MYSRASCHIVDCSKFIYSIYTDIVISCAHKVTGICGIYVHLRSIFVISTSMRIVG